ncbi:MAG: Hcp family type VI secretion system effector [Hydrogenimonas sp.]|nr:Hcp family type VI secretion system effector [Hydrogenimonas sp.]
MNNPIFMSVYGSRQGLITEGAYSKESVGNSYQAGHEKESMIKGFTHNITIPRDPLSGQPSGQRVHAPYVVTKVLDKASPLLMNALVTGETLKKVEIKKYRTNYEGKLEHYFTTILEDAVIVDIQSDAGHTLSDSKLADVAPLEHVSFSYRKISWRHEIASTSGEDDWRKGIGA